MGLSDTAQQSRKPAGQRDGGQFTHKPRANELPLPPPKLALPSRSHRQRLPTKNIKAQQRHLVEGNGLNGSIRRWEHGEETEDYFHDWDSMTQNYIFYIDDPGYKEEAYRSARGTNWYDEITCAGGTLAFPTKLPDTALQERKGIHEQMILYPTSSFVWARSPLGRPTSDFLNFVPPDYVVTNRPESSPIWDILKDATHSWNISTDKSSNQATTTIKIISEEALRQMLVYELRDKNEWQKKRQDILNAMYVDFMDTIVRTDLFLDLRSEAYPSAFVPARHKTMPPELTNMPHLERVTRQLPSSYNQTWENAKPGPINGIAFKIQSPLSSMTHKTAYELIKRYGGRKTSAKNGGWPPQHLRVDEDTRRGDITEAELLEMLTISEHLNG